MQDVRDEIEQHDVVNHYLNPPSKQGNQAGFVVRDAPWDNVRKADGGRKQQPPPQQQSTIERPLPPDTTNIADFPCIGSSAAAPRPTAWGPTRRWEEYTTTLLVSKVADSLTKILVDFISFVSLFTVVVKFL